MKTFLNTAQAAGTYTSNEVSYQTTATSQPAFVTGGSMRVCVTVPTPDAVCVGDACVCHVATRFISACGHTILRAEYQIRLRYTDSCGCDKSVYQEGDVIFFDLPADTAVYFLNPPTVDGGCGGETKVCFRVLLQNPPETQPVCPSNCMKL